MDSFLFFSNLRLSMFSAPVVSPPPSLSLASSLSLSLSLSSQFWRLSAMSTALIQPEYIMETATCS